RRQKSEGRGPGGERAITAGLLPSAFCLLPSAFCLLTFKSVEWTCKPNSVPFAFARGEDHSSVTRVAAVIEQPTRTLITGTGGPITSLFGLAPQGVYRAVAAHAGRGALLPHRFTLASFLRR